MLSGSWEKKLNMGFIQILKIITAVQAISQFEWTWPYS